MCVFAVVVFVFSPFHGLLGTCGWQAPAGVDLETPVPMRRSARLSRHERKGRLTHMPHNYYKNADGHGHIGIDSFVLPGKEEDSKTLGNDSLCTRTRTQARASRRGVRHISGSTSRPL